MSLVLMLRGYTKVSLSSNMNFFCGAGRSYGARGASQNFYGVNRLGNVYVYHWAGGPPGWGGAGPTWLTRSGAGHWPLRRFSPRMYVRET